MAHAQEFDIGGMINTGIDYISGIGKGAVDNSDISQGTKDRVDDAIEGGVPVAKSGVNFYISLHEWIVDMIFSNSPVNVGVGVASIISLALIGFMLFHFVKKIFKWIVILGLVGISIFIMLIVLGIEINV
jgi:hypothetical protein